jgi:redox-sensitive bicupin YhaK (pirin superfamily)
MSLRAVKEVIHTQATREGAGVKLERAFGFGKTKEFDPFLLLDDFRNNNPQDYLAGFPWHPHRGIETIRMCWRNRWSMVTVWATGAA